ncbi:uncharacterized protein LOC135220296 [Macrobrachium nipponense]|uniref:uncharacterized protein LOC135220296 n=1 Tax=Macrobrachium nipponense TaxID=159736 RepID=UPI0030C84357
MVSRATLTFFTTALFLIVLCSLTGPSEAQRAASSGRQFNGILRFLSNLFQPGDLWNRARSVMPRLTDVASDAATVLFMPALTVLAISAVWPHYEYYRNKRAADQEAESPVNELSEHLMNIYFAATESDECIQRIVCEVGASARSLNSENMTSLISLLSASAPSKYNKFFEKFKMGMNAEKCEKIGCSLLDQ